MAIDKLEKRYQVFVSSTYEDLREERQHVIQALLELDCIPYGMELFPSGDDDQWTWIQRAIDDCDYYIVIIAGKYGSCDKFGKSYTQKEYEYAIKKGIPVCGFVHEKPGNLTADKTERTEEGQQKLNKFNILVKKKLVKFWSTPDNLAATVSRSISQLKKSRPAVGWIRANTLLDAVNPEILRLHERIEILEQEKNEALQSSVNAERRINEEAVQQTKRILESFASSGDDTGRFVARAMNYHQIIHKVRDLCVKELPATEDFKDKISSEKLLRHLRDVLNRRRAEVVSIMGDVITMFEHTVSHKPNMWSCIRLRHEDDCYHTFERAGRFNLNRAFKSQPLHKDKAITLMRLKETYARGQCVIVTGSCKGRDMWEPSENDLLGDDKSVLMGTVMAKSWMDDDFDQWKLVMTFSICSNQEGTFNESHIPLMQCCCDAMSVFVNVVLRCL